MVLYRPIFVSASQPPITEVKKHVPKKKNRGAYHFAKNPEVSVDSQMEQ